jgi:hypothetical protein
MSVKRKRVVASLQIELDAIERLDQGEKLRTPHMPTFVAEASAEHSRKEATNCN